jgi:hypothetical protein
MTDARIKEYYSSGVYRQTLGLSQVAMDDDEQQRAREIVDFLEDHKVEPTIHCDIGSSRGYLLDQTNALFGCTTIGRDLNLGYIDVQCEGEGKPDLVTAVHVLEHTTDPKKSLNEWAAMTTRWLLIEVPGEKCKGGPLRWAHTYYFPKPLLERMIIDTGCKIVVSETTETQHTRILAVK